jgi:Leucine-rich repeat (LRR) protein
LRRGHFDNHFAEVIDDLKALPSIRGLDLATNVLHGPLPESFGALPVSLEELRLDENVITSIPESAAALTQLTWFSIRKNLLSAIPASCLMSWTRLEYLDLRHNKLKEVPEELAYCVNLRSLFLSNNELTTLTASVGALTALEVLHIQKNALVELPSSLASCTALVDLDASFNKITELPRGVLASALGLERVIFASNKLTVVPPEIGLLHRLQVLSLAGYVADLLLDE